MTIYVNVCTHGRPFQQSMDQLGMVAVPSRGQLNRENIFTLPPFVPEKLALLDGSTVVSSCVSPSLSVLRLDIYDLKLFQSSA